MRRRISCYSLMCLLKPLHCGEWIACAAFCLSTLISLSTLFTASVHALEDPAKGLQEVGVAPRLGEPIKPTLRFTDSQNRSVTMSELLAGDKPVILTPVYYECPRLCGLVLSAVIRVMNEMSLELGTHYEVVTVSFDSAETPALAAERAAHYHALYRNTAKGPEHWRFLTGDEPNITQLMTQLGFSYQPDAGEFAHAAAIMILTPQGEISQYFTDINVSPWDVRLALIEASQGRIGSAIDHFLLFCFRFDRTKGKYSWAAWNVLRIGSVGSVLVLASIAFVYSRNRQVK